MRYKILDRLVVQMVRGMRGVMRDATSHRHWHPRKIWMLTQL